MEEFFNVNTYPALFLASFMAATFLPLGSELLFGSMLAAGGEPLPLVAVATAGNFLGACTTYIIGLYGGEAITRRVLRISLESQQRGEVLFSKYGSWTLLLSWLPVVGDPLCLAAGFFKVSWLRFSLLVAAGKMGRYTILAFLVLYGQAMANG